MGRPKAPHHRGTYHRRSRALTAAANADPATTCWKCGNTLAQAQALHPHTQVHWCAGHVKAGQIEGDLRPECSPCSDTEGARLRNNGPEPMKVSRNW